MVVRAVVAVTLLTAMLLPIPSVSAQEEPGRFYATNVDGNPANDVCDSGTRYKGSNAAPAAGKAYAAFSVTGLACPFFVDYVTTEDYQLTGNVAIEFWVGCDVASATIELDYSLTIAGENIATVRPSQTGTCAAGGTYLKGGGVHASKELFVPAGSTVTMRFAFFSGPEPGEGPARNVHMTVGGSRPSGFSVAGWGVPYVPPAPADEAAGALQTVYENVTGDLSRTFENTTGAFHYNWTVEPADGTFQAAWNITAGNATVRVADPMNTTVYEGPLAGARNITAAFVGGNGTWQVDLLLAGVSGSFGLSALAPELPAGAGNETVDDVSEGPAAVKDTPSIGILAGLALLAAVAIRRRNA